MNLSKTIMPFGKYKGKMFEEIPRNYIAWLVEANVCREPLSKKVKDYLEQPINWNGDEDNSEEYDQ